MQKHLQIHPATLIIALAILLPLAARANRWETTLVLKGYGTTQTKLVPILGEKWRIKYQAASRTAVKIDMLTPDGQILAHVFNYKSIPAPISGSWSTTPGMEQVALHIDGDVNGWSVTLEQYVDEIGGWKLFKWKRDEASLLQKNLARHAMMTGEASEEKTLKLTVSAQRWRLTATTHQNGKLKYEVLNADGSRLVADHRLTPGQSEAWLYGAGEYTIKVSSVGTAWDLAVDTETQAPQP